MIPNILALDPNPSKLPKWVKSTFILYARGDISEDELLNAIEYLAQHDIIKVQSTSQLNTPNITPIQPIIPNMSANNPIISNVNPQPKDLTDKSTTPTQTTQPSLDSLKNYALQLINQDRAQNGLSPVKLSNNQAAQIHAEDMLKTRTLSHYMSDGEKPYMVYARYNGLGDVAQNAAWQGYEDVQGCIDGTYICDPIDPMTKIAAAEHGMMYDDAGSNWGHRDNILNKHHTDVSIGIAYDKYSFFMTQNFENNYIVFTNPPSENNGIVSFTGNLNTDSLKSIGVYYDPIPTTATYDEHKNDGFYKLGDQIATINSPPDSGQYYPPGNDTFEIADKWTQQGNSVDVSFDLSPFVTKPGVYTIVAYTPYSADQFTLLTYSITKTSPMVQDGFKSPKVYYACTQTQLDQYDQLQQQYTTLKNQYDSYPKTATSDQEYQRDMQVYNQLKSLNDQMQNFRC